MLITACLMTVFDVHPLCRWSTNTQRVILRYEQDKPTSDDVIVIMTYGYVFFSFFRNSNPALFFFFLVLYCFLFIFNFRYKSVFHLILNVFICYFTHITDFFSLNRTSCEKIKLHKYENFLVG